MGAEVDSQVAAPAELRTPNLHRANHRSPKSADGRMAAEAEGLQIRPLDGNCKSCLTRIGLLMEGLGKVISAIAASDCAFDLFAVDSACSRNRTSHPGTNVAHLAFGYSGPLD